MGRQISDSITRGPSVSLTVNDVAVTACAGETLAAALFANETIVFNRTHGGEARAPFCNMGTCFECQVRVARPGSSTYRWLRACVTPVEDGMAVRTGTRLDTPEEDGMAVLTGTRLQTPEEA